LYIWLHDSKLLTQILYSRLMLSYKNAPYQQKHRHACCAYQKKTKITAEKQRF